MSDFGGIAGERLKSLIARVERLEEEKRNIQADIKDVYKEAKGAGFDVATIKELIKLRRMDATDRREREELLDLYKAALGMLYDTPLGEAARRRLAEAEADKRKPPAPPPAPPPAAEAPASAGPAPETTPEEARAMGRMAAQEGHAVTTNPFPPHDARRAAWDEGWCAASGTDGMEIPDAYRRKGKKKPPKPAEPPAEAGTGGDDKKGEAA